MFARYGIAVVTGAIITGVLFYIMQALILNDNASLDEGKKRRLADFIQVEDDINIETKIRKPKPPPPPDEPPPDQPKPDFDSSDVSQGIDIGAVNVNVDLNIGGTGGFSSDGEYLPIVKVAPQYPRRAQTRGLEGYVLLEFTVTKTGAVQDPVVIEAKPPGIFDRAAMKAALKFKYKPKVVNGEAVDVAGVRNLIKFELAE